MKYEIEVLDNGRISYKIDGVLISNNRHLTTTFQLISQHYNKNVDEEGIPFHKEIKDSKEATNNPLGKLLGL